MTLLIAFILCYVFKLHWIMYVVSVLVYIISLIGNAGLVVEVTEKNNDKIVKKLFDVFGKS